jgi:hypothetical protein
MSNHLNTGIAISEIVQFLYDFIIAKAVVRYCLNCKDLLIDGFPFNPDKVEGLLDFLLSELRKQLG